MKETHSPVDLVDRVCDAALSDVASHVAGARIAGYSDRPAWIYLENTSSWSDSLQHEMKLVKVSEQLRG